MYCPSSSVLSILSRRPVPAVLFQLLCPATLSTATLVLLSCHCCHVLVSPRHSSLSCSGSSVEADMSGANLHVEIDLSWLSCPCGTVPDVLSLLSYFGRSVLCFPSWPHHPDCLLQLVCPSCPALALLSWHSSFGCPAPVFLPRLTCPSCPAPALLFPVHLSRKSCPCCHVLTILSSLSCPGWPVRPNNPNRPVWAVLSYCYTPVVKSQVSCCVFRCPGPAPILNRLSCLMSCPGCTGPSLHGFWKLRSNNK